MKAAPLRHKHLQLDQGKLNRAKRILGARTETEALDRALSIVVSEADIDKTLRKIGGKAEFERSSVRNATDLHRQRSRAGE